MYNNGAVQKKTAYCLDKNANSLFVFDTWLLQQSKDVKQYLHVSKQPLQFLCSLCCLSNYSKWMSMETGELFSGFFLSKQTLLVGQLYSQILIQKNLNHRLCYVFALIFVFFFFLCKQVFSWVSLLLLLMLAIILSPKVAVVHNSKRVAYWLMVLSKPLSLGTRVSYRLDGDLGPCVETPGSHI